MKTLRHLQQIAEGLSNPYLEDARRNGGGIIGYFCSYVPEEIIAAPGFIPYRMRSVGSEGTGFGDRYFSSLNCSHVRHCLDQALQGRFDFLQGIVFMNGCDHNRRLYDNWRYALQAPEFKHLLVVPHVVTPAARVHYHDNLLGMMIKLETHYSISISKESLQQSICHYNTRRRLLMELYRKRTGMPALVSGNEFLSVMLAITAMPVEQSIVLLNELLHEIDSRAVMNTDQIRVMIVGNCTDEVKHLQFIEDCGCSIVADKLCLGSPYWHTLVREDGDPLSALADRYLEHLSCARMVNDFSRRSHYLVDAVNRYAIDGIILDKIKFCTIFDGESALLRAELKKARVPVLALEREVYGGSTGQMKTRIQAFLEMIKASPRKGPPMYSMAEAGRLPFVCRN